MKLVASMVVRNEADRYLDQCLEHLHDFCDDIVVLDDSSDDDTVDLLRAHGVEFIQTGRSEFYQHEGHTRQKLLDHTLTRSPDYILAIDADEFVADGQALRAACERRAPVVALRMCEIWKAGPTSLFVRHDGQWSPRPIPCVYAPGKFRRLQIAPRALACGREPQQVVAVRGRAKVATDILHFGWACAADRQIRYDRYVEHDGGKFHRNPHLESIMWPDAKVDMRPMPWPNLHVDLRDSIHERANRHAPSAVSEMPGMPADLALWNEHSDGRWVGITWDGRIVTGP